MANLETEAYRSIAIAQIERDEMKMNTPWRGCCCGNSNLDISKGANQGGRSWQSFGEGNFAKLLPPWGANNRQRFEGMPGAEM